MKSKEWCSNSIQDHSLPQYGAHMQLNAIKQVKDVAQINHARG